MKSFTFAKRNTKELIRDPLNIAFGIGFPIVLLLLLSAIQRSIPVSLFEIQTIAPGIVVFGLSFMTLFSATIIAKDRKSSLLQRLYTSPMKPYDFILGYTLPIIIISVIQSIVCYVFAIILGLEFSVNILYSILFLIPIAIFYIALGLLCGSLFTDKQVGGICGALLTNVSAWLSGIWFDLELVGGVFREIAYLLPFVHAVNMQRAVLIGDFSNIFVDLLWVLGYGIVLLVMSILVFLKQMKKQ